MKNLLTFGLLAWMVAFTSCKKGDALNPIKLDPQTSISTIVHDSTFYVYPNGYTDSTVFIQPVKLGVPKYLVAQSDVISNSLMSSVNTSLPNRISVVAKHPEYLATEAVNTINVITTADIYVTFVADNSGAQNTLAYYTYKTNEPPVKGRGGSDNGAMDKITYIFPYVKDVASGGGLTAGNKVKLGNFSAGTSISFVLITKSWNGVEVNPANTKFYSQDNLNPETISSLQRHAVMLYNNASNLYLVGFEWQNRQTGSCDNDFNDLIFYVSSNITNGISNHNVVSIDETAN